MKRLLPLCALLCATLPAFAFLDANNNGLSDLWERTYNNGQLFGLSFDPQADADGDGWTNAQEAGAGTNPFDPNPPEGFVRPQLTNIPAVWSEPDENGDSVIVTPASMFMEWQTIPGKQYTLLYSPDLIDWLAVPNETFIGSGSIRGYGIELTDEKLFWRVKIDDVDSDGDGLTDAEEYMLGTNPNNSQTLPGCADLWLATNFTEMLLNGQLADIDTDGDGLTNAQEAFLGTNPSVPDNPGILQEAIANGDFSAPLIGTGLLADTTWDYWAGVPGWTAVVGANIEFQNIDPITQSNQYCELKAEPEGHYGIKQQVGTRIGANYLLVLDCKDRADVAPENSNFDIRIDGQTVRSITFAAHGAWTTCAVAFKAAAVITEVSLVPVNDSNDTLGCLVDNVKLVPVELRGFFLKDAKESVGVSNGNYVYENRRVLTSDPNDPIGFKTEVRSELKISQWDDVFDYSNSQWSFSYDMFKTNADVFRIRIPKTIPSPESGKHLFKIWTTKPDGTTADEGATIELDDLTGCFQSGPLCLVADETDDTYAVDGKADGTLNDHTFRAELGGELKYQWLTAPGADPKPTWSVPVPAKKVITANGYILQKGNIFTSNAIEVAKANDYFERARTILATCAVKLNYQVLEITPNPPGVDFGSGILFDSVFLQPRWELNHVALDPEPKAVMDDVRCKPASDVIPIYFVGYFEGGGTGVTTVQSAMLPADIGYANAVFLDSQEMSQSTLAHEAMHVVLDAVHAGPNCSWTHYNEETPWCIWYTSIMGFPEEGILARKRIIDTMRSRLLKSKFCKDPAP